jgi:DHA1 family tetracycline resistance protein-like MFS transporter
MKVKTETSLSFIYLTVFLNAVGWGILVPVMPDLLRQFSSDPSFVARNQGHFIALYSVTAFIFSPTLGMLSDWIGRRPVLLLAILGSSLDYLAMTFAPTLTILFFARLVAGATAASHTVAAAFVADVSDDSNRRSRFGILASISGVGYILGPVVGGLAGGKETVLGPRTPFLLAAVLTATNFAFGLLVMPESLASAKRRRPEWRSLNPFPALFRAFRHPGQRILLLLYAGTEFAERVNGATWALYNEMKFGWRADEVGWSFAFVGICLALANGWAAPKIIARFGESSTLKLTSGLLFISLLGFALSTRSWMMIALIVVFALAYTSIPTMQSMASKLASADTQGEVQGVLFSLRSLTAIGGPLFYTAIFSEASARGWPGGGYFAASAIALLIWIMALIAIPKH